MLIQAWLIHGAVIRSMFSTARASFYKRETWSNEKAMYSGSAAFSSFTNLKNGEIGLIFEKDDYSENVFVKFPLDFFEAVKIAPFQKCSINFISNQFIEHVDQITQFNAY